MLDLNATAADTTSAGNGAAPVPPRSAQASYRHLQLDGGKPWWMINATISTCPPPQPGDQLKNHGHHPDSIKFWSIEAYNIIYINSPCDQCQRPHPWAKTASPETINTSGYVSGTLQMIASILRRGIHRLPKDGNSFWLFPNLHKPIYIYIYIHNDKDNDQNQHFASWADIVSIGSCMHIMQCKKNYL